MMAEAIAQPVLRPLLVGWALLVCAAACAPQPQTFAPSTVPLQASTSIYPATAGAPSTIVTPQPTPATSQATPFLAPTPTIQRQATPQITATPEPAKSTPIVASTFYGMGVVTRINPAFPSIELNHAEIKGYMPAMTMEYFVQNIGLLQGISVGDRVTFTILDRGSTPVIVEIKKQKPTASIKQQGSSAIDASLYRGV